MQALHTHLNIMYVQCRRERLLKNWGQSDAHEGGDKNCVRELLSFYYTPPLAGWAFSNAQSSMHQYVCA